MKEKLVEEWLIRAGERGGIDQAFGQWLISEGHEILWLGHSGTEFGKDIVSIAPNGSYHAYQMKDEDLTVGALRAIHDQVTELVDLPPIHPRIPSGSLHVPHLVTSGLANEQAAQRIRALNDKLRVQGRHELELVDRRSLIPRFVTMSDSFWPEKPANIRDFFSFYLAEGKGDFDPKRFSKVLCELLINDKSSKKRKAQRLSAIGLLGNYLLHPFEREGDHWSLFQGWTMIAAHLAWFAAKAGLSKKTWLNSFNLAKQAAIEQMIALSTEALKERALTPSDWEFDDYTRCRNLTVSAVLSATCLLGKADRIGGVETANLLVKRLAQDGRLICWGEGAVSALTVVLWHMELGEKQPSALSYIHSTIDALCERNHLHSEDERLEPPHIQVDEILERLLSHEQKPDTNRRGRASWTLESLLYLLTRRSQRDFLSSRWAGISKLEMISFLPDDAEDMLIWQCDKGHELQRHPERTQSWTKLVEEAESSRAGQLPSCITEDLEFALMFLLTYPHRFCPALVQLLDAQKGCKSESCHAA